MTRGEALQITDLGQGVGDETPLPHARVRDLQVVFVDAPVVIQQQVEVERT